MRRRTLIFVGCLELFALLLANWQALGGVRTDEAKYLLNIPYPHPPLIRSIFSATEWLPFHEMFWRVVLASLLVQAIWLVWDFCRDFRLEDRASACVAWILAAAVLTQAGSIMLSPVVALEVLVWLWLRKRPDTVRQYPLLMGIFWMVTVFSSFQGVLFAPLAWHALRRGGQSRSQAAVFVLGPIALLALYALSNPLVLATMLIHKNDGATLEIGERFWGFAKVWTVGGGLVGSFFGTWGIVQSRDRFLQMSFALLCAYVLVSVPYPFYAILFTPLFIGGLFELFHMKRHPHGFPLLSVLVFGSAIIVWFVRPLTDPSAARLTMREIDAARPSVELLLIQGSFGHQWQYETHAVVERYRPEGAADADAIVCLTLCEPMFNTTGWMLLANTPVETWVRK